jgi:hypothetical protein
MAHSQHRVVVLPAHNPEHSAPHFDAHQFQNHGRFLQSGSAGLDWSNLRFMHLKQIGARKPVRGLPTPAWALDDAATREVIVSYLEERNLQRVSKRIGTLLERLERVRAKAAQRLPKLRATRSRVRGIPRTQPQSQSIVEDAGATRNTNNEH